VETFRSGADSSLFDLASRLARTEGDGIFIIASAMDTAILCQQLKKLGNTRPVLTSEWAATDELIAFGGRAVEGVTFLQTFDRDSPLPRYQEFRRAFRDRFRTEPRFASVHGYDAANIVFSALSRSTDPKEVAEVLLAGGPYPGVQSKLAFTPDGDIHRPLFLTAVHDGRFVRLKAP
jgi:branched-chain amino acid transport system substrate-binding protein